MEEQNGRTKWKNKMEEQNGRIKWKNKMKKYPPKLCAVNSTYVK